MSTDAQVESQRFQALFQHAPDLVAVLDGRGRTIYASPRQKFPTDISPDGGLVLFQEQTLDPVKKTDIFVVRASGGAAVPVVEAPLEQSQAVFSPDGRAIAYVSNESGVSDVFVQSFSPPGSGGSRSIVDIDTFPATYGGGGTWSHTYYIRNGPIVVEPVTAVPGSSVYGVSRGADKLDVFLTNTKGFVRTASWEPAFTDGFRGWRKINDGMATPGGPVTVISRAPDQLDIFVTGTDGHVYSAAWNPAHTDGWHGWWQIGDVTVPQGTAVHGVSRTTDKLDIFVTDVNEVIRTASWEPAFPDGWRGWREINGGRAKPGTPVTAISRSTDQLDIFVTGLGGRVSTAAWHPTHTDGWHGWWLISDVAVPAYAAAQPVVRLPNHLDVFFVGTDNNVHLASWSDDVAFGHWRG